jgi:hypothetical protein
MYELIQKLKTGHLTVMMSPKHVGQYLLTINGIPITLSSGIRVELTKIFTVEQLKISKNLIDAIAKGQIVII